MEKRRSLLAAWVLLCIIGTLANIPTTGGAPQRTSPVTPKLPDSGRACSCLGVANRTLDCSNRGRNIFRAKDFCTGRTTEIDLSQNSFTEFPRNLGSYIVEVNISSNQLTALPRAPSLNSNTTLLDISNNRISQASNELRSLSSLKILSVAGNHLQTLTFLPETCVLENLNAQNNAIRNLEGPLSSCSKLEILDLSNNQLTFQVLDITSNGLTLLTSGIFSPLKQLKELYLDDNNITSLSAEAFNGLHKVKWISLKGNKLTSLPVGIFLGLHKLESILLMENELISLPENIFSGLRELENVALHTNKLETLPPRLFAGLRSLKVVSLAANLLTTLPADMFEGVSSLTVIEMHSNRLSSLPTGFFRGMNSVKFLDLADNHFTTIRGRDFIGLQSIWRLDLVSNLLLDIPIYDASWPDVTLAFFDKNKIVNVSESALRSWLGSGDKRRMMSVGYEQILRHPASLRWALNDEHVTTVLTDDCKCGGLRRGKAEVQFCVAVSCPGATASWVEAVRTAS